MSEKSEDSERRDVISHRNNSWKQTAKRIALPGAAGILTLAGAMSPDTTRIPPPLDKAVMLAGIILGGIATIHIVGSIGAIEDPVRRFDEQVRHELIHGPPLPPEPLPFPDDPSLHGEPRQQNGPTDTIDQ